MSKKSFKFEVIHQSSRSGARVGKIYTPHGVIETPCFVPVGTNGCIKAIDSVMLDQYVDIQLMFCNTYHLVVQPGADVVEAAGGLHRFMNRNKPIITDSGGFQVFSLAYGGVTQELKSKGRKVATSQVAKITEDGVTFRSYRNGDRLHLSPESSIDAQKKIGADIILVFDELLPFHVSDKKLKRSFDRTHRWELRSLRRHIESPSDQALYAIVHGGVDADLRRKSAELLAPEPFDGFAIGGSFGESRDQMVQMLSGVMPSIPSERPRHLLGIADIPSINEVVPLGIDTFDSAYPTKCARHGMVLTSSGPQKITRAGAGRDFGPLVADCSCMVCTHYSRAYLVHLFKAHELAAYHLLSLHNLFFMERFVRGIREAILDDRL